MIVNYNANETMRLLNALGTKVADYVDSTDIEVIKDVIEGWNFSENASYQLQIPLLLSSVFVLGKMSQIISEKETLC